MDLKDIAAVVADWADQYPLIGVAYIFGSRVRGDHKAESDLDVAIDFDLSQGSSEVTPFDAELASECAGLKSMILAPIVLHIHKDFDDLAWPSIRAGECIHRDRKVQCVIVPPKPSALS